MRSFLPALTLILLGASPCVISEVDQSVHWAGWVLTDMPSDEGNEVLQTGAVEITTPDGTSLGEADASTSSPGFFSLDVEADTEIGLRITGESIHPTVWRTRTPRSEGYWLYGALFGVDAVNLDLTLSSLAELTAQAIPWQDDQAGVLIYGAPTIRDAADEAAWTGAELTALDSEGGTGTVITLAHDPETGITGVAAGPSGLVGPDQVVGPVVLFVAYDLAPGPIRLIAQGSDGRTAVADWASLNGDVLSAFHLTLPESK